MPWCVCVCGGFHPVVFVFRCRATDVLVRRCFRGQSSLSSDGCDPGGGRTSSVSPRGVNLGLVVVCLNSQRHYGLRSHRPHEESFVVLLLGLPRTIEEEGCCFACLVPPLLLDTIRHTLFLYENHREW